MQRLTTSFRSLAGLARLRGANSRTRTIVMAVAACATLLPGAAPISGVHAAAAPVLMGPAGPVQPPTAALQPNGTPGQATHAMGLLVPAGATMLPRARLSAPVAGITSLPASADLSQYDPPVGDQGGVNSCVSWSTGYYLQGWYAKRDGYYPAGGANGWGSFAPMYLYNQVTGGQNVGTSFGANLDVQVAQGIDTRADYTQGDYDFTDAPTAAERANAGSYKVASYTTIFPNAAGTSAQQAIESAIAGGDPVAVGIGVYGAFYNAGPTSYYVDVPNATTGTSFIGNHAVFASKYDANGLWVENQWGTGWGKNGWVELSWAYVNGYVWQAVTLRPAATAPTTTQPTATNTATPVPPTATNAATATPIPPTATNTATATPVPPTATNTATATPVPPTATNTPRPVLPTATNTPRPVPPTATNTPRPIAPMPTRTATPRPVAPTATPIGWHHKRGGTTPTGGSVIAASPTPQTARATTTHHSSTVTYGKTGSHLAAPPRRPAPRATPRVQSHTAVPYRDITVPAHARHVMLRFAYRAPAPSSKGARTSHQNWLEVDLLSPQSGRLLARVLHAAPARRQSTLQRANTWQHASYDLTRFKGRRVRLLVRGQAHSSAVVDLTGVRISAR